MVRLRNDLFRSDRVKGGMIRNTPNVEPRDYRMAEPASVAQLRREAGKARTLGNAAFGIEERRQLFEIAAALEREATLLEAALVAKTAALRPPPQSAQPRRVGK